MFYIHAIYTPCVVYTQQNLYSSSSSSNSSSSSSTYVVVVPYHRCIRVCMAGYDIGRIHEVTGRLCVEAHILRRVREYVLQDENTICTVCDAYISNGF